MSEESQPETREQALDRIVGEMLEEGKDLTKGGLPELPVLNEEMFNALMEAEPEIEEGNYWAEVKADERADVVKKIEAALKAEPEIEEEGLEGLPEIYPTTLYAPGKPSKVVDDADEAERAIQSGYKCFDDFTVEERRAMHPMCD